MGLADAEQVKDAAEAYIYGYPLVYDLEEVAGFVAGGGSLGWWERFRVGLAAFSPPTADKQFVADRPLLDRRPHPGPAIRSGRSGSGSSACTGRWSG